VILFPCLLKGDTALKTCSASRCIFHEVNNKKTRSLEIGLPPPARVRVSLCAQGGSVRSVIGSHVEQAAADWSALKHLYPYLQSLASPARKRLVTQSLEERCPFKVITHRSRRSHARVHVAGFIGSILRGRVAARGGRVT